MVLVLASLNLPTMVGWLLATIGMTSSAPGSRPYFLASSLERLCRWPLIANRCLMIAAGLHLQAWGAICFQVLLLAYVVWFAESRKDRDDAWTDLGKRIRRWAAARRSRLLTA